MGGIGFCFVSKEKERPKWSLSLSVFRVSLHFSFTMSYKFSTTKLRIAINRLFPYPSAFNFLLPFTGMTRSLFRSLFRVPFWIRMGIGG